MSITAQADTAPIKDIALEVRGLWAGYQSRVALEDVSFQLPAGSLTGLVGPNGSGKSTLLRVIVGLQSPWRGSVSVLGENGRQGRRHLGYMPQTELVDWSFPVSVFDVVMMGRYGRLGLLRRPGRQDRQIVRRCLEQVGLSDLADRQIGELSGGQQRRALIARALAQKGEVLLLDEPTTGLDASAQHDLLELLELLRNDGKTLLVATHDLSWVATCCDCCILVNTRLIACGQPREVLTEERLLAAYQHHLAALLVSGRPYGDTH